MSIRRARTGSSSLDLIARRPEPRSVRTLAPRPSASPTSARSMSSGSISSRPQALRLGAGQIKEALGFVREGAAILVD